MWFCCLVIKSSHWRRCGLVVESSQSIASDKGIQQDAQNLCRPFWKSLQAILSGTEPASGLTCMLRYCCTLHDFFFFRSHLWWSCNDRALNHDMNIWLQLFWSTWNRLSSEHLGRDLPRPGNLKLTMQCTLQWHPLVTSNSGRGPLFVLEIRG